MGSGFLCCMVLCLLGAAPLDTTVSQTPRYLIAHVGSKKSLKCEQNLGHNAMYWYKQDLKQLLNVMFIYNNKELILNESVPGRFSPETSDKAHLNLHVDSLETGDSAVYFCASSQDTALQSHYLPVHKPPGSARQLYTRATCSPDPEAPFTPSELPDWSFLSLVQAANILDGADLQLCSEKPYIILLISLKRKNR
ncbi:unnamed protein product [Nyctereutes procyonoides]|uniref:(raccoon dog) hypothetical protein n=1 Tax=Nyctereutes procyonoides TaxID=34880 RepID=A0A811YVS9_NYCPR|nr:unnamed protein product [Nyctereutes procyonoides]